MNYTTLLLTLFFTSLSCSNETPVESGVCNQNLLITDRNYLLQQSNLPDYIIMGLAKDPDMQGALGRNKEGYFHVRFQLDIAFLASYAVRFESDDALEKFIHSTEYSFAYQKSTGDFDVVVPEDLLYLGEPLSADLTSGIAFFLSALGSSLILLEQSDWYINRPADNLTQRMTNLKEKFQLSLTYLKTQQEVLKIYDDHAPNRLLFDAIAYYAMGIYLNDNEAKTIGIAFVNLALERQDSAGYFIEGDGFDSSYNGVALRLGLVLLGILPSQETIVPDLKSSLACCAQWQLSRVLSTGEISAEGNTRVYPGGEGFLGQEKTIAWIDTVLSFYYISDTGFTATAEKIEMYYK